MLKIHSRSNASGLGQIIGIYSKFIYIADQDSFMIFCAGIRSDNFVSRFYLIILISELIKLQGSL